MKKLFFASIFILMLGAGLFAQDCATGYCPATITVHHRAGAVAPITGNITYGVVTTTLFTGSNKCAITRNLGATTAASSATDAAIASAGWYWQFNRKQGYSHDGTTRTPNTTWISSISETSDWLAANDPCTLLLGTTWRLPTNAEWTAADASGWATYTDTYNSVLKLHAAGFLGGAAGGLGIRGTGGYYWSGPQYSATSGYSLSLGSSNASTGTNSKAYGFSVRCLRDY